MKQYDVLIEEIREFTKKNVKKSRFEHSERVADMCVLLAEKAGADTESAYLAGIGHDMCKDFSDERLIELAAKDGKAIIDYDRRKPALLHGRAAAVLMKEKFGVTDKSILDAVAVHTSGMIGMDALAKCLFLADKIEPGRPQSTDEYRERLLKMSLNEMFVTVLEENYNYVFNKGYEIYPGTKVMVDYYKAHRE